MKLAQRKQHVKGASFDLGKDFARSGIQKIAKIYKEKLPGLDEFWIMVVAKPDMITKKVNVMIRAFDRAKKPNYPIQGAQMWYVNWSKGIIQLDWILPLQQRRVINPLQYSENNLLILNSLDRANKCLGGNLLDANPFGK